MDGSRDSRARSLEIQKVSELLNKIRDYDAITGLQDRNYVICSVSFLILQDEPKKPPFGHFSKNFLLQNYSLRVFLCENRFCASKKTPLRP
jgi:hypothetical protein